MTTLKINFQSTTATADQIAEFNTAIQYEHDAMSIQLIKDSMSKLETKIANKNGDYSTEEIQGFQAQLDKLENEKSKLDTAMSEAEPVYTAVVADMSAKNADHFGNDRDTVRTVLRTLATCQDSKLIKYAIIPAFQSPDLYNALETIHINSKAGEGGYLIMSQDVKYAYKKASDELERIIKVTFSLPFATTYTDKTRVKLTADDKKLLNDCYIKGFSNKFNADDSGVVTFKKRQINTLVRARKNKKTGETTYDYSGLASTIANIVLKHYFTEK